MNKRYSRKKDGLIPKQFSTLLFLSVCFVIGIILGCMFASYSTARANSGLLSYIERYLTLAQEDQVEWPSLFSVFWEVSRWPLAAGVFGLTLLGVAVVPLLFLIRGFLLSYAVSIFVSVMGMKGLGLAIAIFGISALFSIAALFMIGTEAFTCGRALNEVGGKTEHSNRIKAQKHLVFQLAITIGWLCAGTMIQYWISPILLRVAANFYL